MVYKYKLVILVMNICDFVVAAKKSSTKFRLEFSNVLI